MDDNKKPSAEPAGQHDAGRLVAQPLLYARLMEMSEILRAGSRWNGNENEFADKTESDVAMLDDILGDALRLAAEPPVDQSSRVLSEIADMADEEIADMCVRVRPDNFRDEDGDIDYFRYDASVVRAVVVELATRCRAEGGNTKPESSPIAEPDTATQAPSVKQLAAQLCDYEEKWTPAEQQQFGAWLNANFPNEASQGIISLGSAWKAGQRATQAAKPLTNTGRVEICNLKGD